MKRSAVALGLLALGVAACHKSCSYSASTSMSFGTDAGTLPLTPPVPSTLDAGGVPARFAGVFHLTSPDEINLALDPSGTFHWRVFGCDSVNASCGQWATKGNLVVLTPRGTDPTLPWITEGSLRERVTRVDVAEHGGHLELRGYRPDGTSFAQVWLPGRACAPCGGEGGASLSLCETPFPSTCP